MPWEETENEIRHRVRQPDLFQAGSFVTKEFQAKPRIYSVMGKLKGEDTMTVQAMRFEKPAWTLAEAKKWMEGHMDIEKSCGPDDGCCTWCETGGEIRYQVASRDLFESDYTGRPGVWEVRELSDAGNLFYARVGTLLGHDEKRIYCLIFPKVYWTQAKAKNWVDRNIDKIMSGEVYKSAAVVKAVPVDLIEFCKGANLEPQGFVWLAKDFTEDSIKQFLLAKSLDLTGLKKSGDRWTLEVRPESQFQKGSLRDLLVRDGFVMSVGLLSKEVQKADVAKRVPERFALKASDLSYLDDLDIFEVTLTKSPVLGKMAEFTIVKSIEGSEQNYLATVPILKVDAERRQVGGYALVPDLPDWQGDILSKEAVEKAAYNFLKNLSHRNQLGQGSGLEHVQFEGIGYPIESFMDRDGIHGVKDGWFLKTQVVKDDVWADVKKGLIVGYSIGGKGTRRKAEIVAPAGVAKAEFSNEEVGLFRRMLNFLKGETVAKAVTHEPVPVVAPAPTAIIDSKEDTTMSLDVTKCYSAEEIAKAKEKGIDLAKATEGMEIFLKAIGMNFDWRGIGAMTLEFSQAAKNGEFGKFPTDGIGSVLKSQPDDQLAQIEKAMQGLAAQNEQTQVQMAQMAQAYEQIMKSRGQRQSVPGLPTFQIQPEEEFQLNSIDLSPSDSKRILGIQ